jgi:hypothetical protein
MYRKPPKQDRAITLDLDSLMDILSCLVGVMLFLVMYTVLELGSAAYQAEVVVSPTRSPGSRRVEVVAEAGTVKLLDVRPALADLLSGFEIVQSVGEVQTFVDASRAGPPDPYFQYSLTFEVRATTDLLGMLDLVVQEKPVDGETFSQLDEDSRFAAALDALDPEDAWLAFAVDDESVDAFRRARELAIERGFASEFDLLTLDFPLTLPLSSDGIGDLLSRLSTLSKPEN